MNRSKWIPAYTAVCGKVFRMKYETKEKYEKQQI